MQKQSFKAFLKWIFPIFCLIFILQISIVVAIFYFVSIGHAKNYLQQEIKRVKEDIKYENGKWDTSQYNADSDVPNADPMYIITSDGFVIDRWKPIHGLLDISEFSRLITYTTPQTINTITNENWRVLAKPISNGEEIIGVILVTEYRPDPNNLNNIDDQLTQTIADIEKNIAIKGTAINTSKLDPRKLPFNITYQIVNKFNKILVQSDNSNSITRTPTFIDTSYIDNQLQKGREEQITDSVTHKKFLINTSPIYSQKHEVVGIIVAGVPIDTIYTAIKEVIVYLSATSFLLLILFSPIVVFLIDKLIKKGIEKGSVIENVNKIVFLKKQNKLIIDNFTIDIPYASYQYYFCLALFSKPEKRWETDEIVDLFGEDLKKESWRKPYDTMVALNKKALAVLGKKLFVIKDRTYFINPSLISKVVQN